MTASSRFRLDRPRLLALGILALALIIRIWGLTARSLWLDEAVEYWTDTSPLVHLPAMVREIIQDPPLYSFLLHLWMQPSNHEFWLRLLSVFFGVGAVAGVMVVGYRLRGWTTALAAGFLMAVMPTSVHYAQEVGQYAPMLFFVAWGSAALLAVEQQPERASYLRWGAITMLGIYTYYGAVLPLLVPFGCLTVGYLLQRNRAQIRNALLTLLGVFVAILPLLVYFIPHQLHRGPTQNAFEPAKVASMSQGAGDIWKALKVTVGFWFTGWPCTAMPDGVAIGLFLLLVVLVVRSQRRFALWIGVTLVVYALIGWLHVFPFGFRHSIVMIPLVVPLLACAVAGNAWRVRRAVALLAFAGLCLSSMLSPTDPGIRRSLFGTADCLWPETEDVGPVTKYWAEHRTPGQPTYVYYAAAPAFAYYAERYTHDAVSRPPDWFLHCWRGDDAPWCREDNVYYGRWLRSMQMQDKMDSVFQSMNQIPNEFWFIMAHAQKNEQETIGGALHQHFDFVDTYPQHDAAAVLLRRNSR
ncbi:MAG TPA: glycosyltransferase family 39 protein [Candidatus Krumholzibacteria bacterium]|nr:glycosyltransferase family 39 protein [Candidatus Krumholzibacteria bacterium]